jgi:hypothetical protein
MTRMKEEDGVKGYWAGGELGCQLGLRGKGREEGCGPEKKRGPEGKRESPRLALRVLFSKILLLI